MTHPALLIAGREFRTYAGTASFWIALAVGPMIMGGALALTGGAKPPPPSASLVLHQVGRASCRERVSNCV